MAKVGIVMGSDSDWHVVEPGVRLLSNFGVECETVVASAHRTPEAVRGFTVSAKEKGIGVLIAVAGAAAHLPGVVASFTTLPVIGVPVSGSALKGIDALLSIVQMPSGIPVATMAIDGGKNAALYALSILALKDDKLANRLLNFRSAQAEEVHKKNAALQEKIKETAKTTK
jgi:5-(carboxyamino)imidazole ribonucleotide mutase